MSNEQTMTAVAEPVVQMPPYGMDFRQWFEYKAKLAKKKSAVMAAVATIPKNGFNEEHGYAFAKDADINDGLRTLLHDNQLDFDIEFLNRHHRGNIVEVMLLVTWTDCETGYFESRKWLAAGFDTLDKGIYKAYTGGGKYYLMRTFLMSQGDTDPEYTERRKAKDMSSEEVSKMDPEGLPVRDITEEAGMQKAETKAEKAKREKAEKAARAEKAAADEAAAAEAAAKEAEKGDGAGTGDKAADGHTEAAEKDPAQPGKITSEQVGKFKVALDVLAAFSEDKNKVKAKEAVFSALAIKKELREWGERIKRMTADGEKIEALTEVEAAEALKYMAAWSADKAKRKGGNGNA